ncbi:hypothetical protein [Castellaniella sp.]|uniref:secretion/conjugation apparatus DotM-related subunit n=1 Tax=Castellaniella sp. TaxID=1955812 RepID=UPI002AFE7002|nr:hypothetical protein [Castellaniella sp.]
MARNRNQGGTDRTFQFSDPASLAGILAVVLLLAWGIWYFAHEAISAVYVYVRYVQLWIFNLAGAFMDLPGLSAIYNWVQRMCAPDRGVLLCTRDFSSVQWSDISNSSTVFNGLLLIPLGMWLFSMFRHVDREHPTIKFSKGHNLRSFVQENAALYPHLKLVSRLDLVSKPLDDPIFGMSLTSRQFVYEHRLISGWQQAADGQYVPVLDREAAAKVLLRQLGRHWTRSADLSPGETLLLAIVLPRVAATDPAMDDETFRMALDDSDGLIKWCWDHYAVPDGKVKGTGKGKGEDDYAWLRPEFDLAYPKKIIARYVQHPVVTSIISKHAFRRTILYACYAQATSLGVFPPADVRWLRFYDRELWHLRSSMGRQVAFAEGGNAVFCHYLYETKTGGAIVEPQLDKAINGLDTAMRAFKYVKADKDAYDALAR